MNTDKGCIRVLHVFGNLNLGGAESRTVDLYRRIDRKKVQFDFLVHTDKPSYYDDTVKAMGARIYRIPRFTGGNIVQYRRAVEIFFMEHRGEWKVIHGHMTSTAAIYLKAAKKAGMRALSHETPGGTFSRKNNMPVTVAHARSAGVDPGLKGVVTKLMRLPLRGRVVDKRFACTREAGAAAFGRRLVERGRVEIIPNAIDLEKYGYDEITRGMIRDELGIPEDAVVIGHVGSFRYAKNHEYLLKIFKELSDREGTGQFRLLLIGDGELRAVVTEQAVSLGISDRVVFAGSRGDVGSCLSAMDIFVFPSRYEGLPGSVIEAQATGLPCLISDRIPKETVVTSLVEQRSIDDPPEAWADRIRQMIEADKHRLTTGEELDEVHRQLHMAGFDAAGQAARLQKFYMNTMES